LPTSLGFQSERQDADGGREFLRASHRDEATLGDGNAVGTYSPLSFPHLTTARSS
jgi:hypothetical protein